MDWHTDLGAILQVIAALISPVAALQVQARLDHRRQRRERQLRVFRELMATRAMNTSARHVEALNTIDVEFDGESAKESAVRAAWKAYIDHVSTPPNNDSSWGARRIERLIDLLHAISEVLGYRLDKTHLKTVQYHPDAMVQESTDQDMARKAFLGLMRGQLALPIRVAGETPPAAERPALEPGPEALRNRT